MWPFHRKPYRTEVEARASNAGLRDARARVRALEDGQLTTEDEATIREAEARADDLEERSDRVAESLMDRLRRNTFAEGVAMAWGQPARHRREGA